MARHLVYGAGVINQQAIHHLDVLNWICGPIKRVIASQSNIRNKLEAEDTMMVLVDFQKGYSGTIEASTALIMILRHQSQYMELMDMQKYLIALNEIDKWSFKKGKNLQNFKTKIFTKKNKYGVSITVD